MAALAAGRASTTRSDSASRRAVICSTWSPLLMPAYSEPASSSVWRYRGSSTRSVSAKRSSCTVAISGWARPRNWRRSSSSAGLNPASTGCSSGCAAATGSTCVLAWAPGASHSCSPSATAAAMAPPDARQGAARGASGGKRRRPLRLRESRGIGVVIGAFRTLLSTTDPVRPLRFPKKTHLAPTPCAHAARRPWRRPHGRVAAPQSGALNPATCHRGRAAYASGRGCRPTPRCGWPCRSATRAPPRRCSANPRCCRGCRPA